MNFTYLLANNLYWLKITLLIKNSFGEKVARNIHYWNEDIIEKLKYWFQDPNSKYTELSKLLINN